MYDSYSKGVSYGNGFLILIGLWFGGLLLGGVLSIPVWLLMTGRGLATMTEDMMMPQYVNALRVIQVVSTLVTFFLPAFFTALIINRRPFKLMGFTAPATFRQFLLSIAIIFCGAIIAGALSELNEMIPISKKAADFFTKMEESYSRQVEAITSIKNFGDYIVSLFMIALLPAMFEESFFRGGMQNLLTRSIKNPWLAILITSCIFSIIHLSYYGFLARLCLGIVLGLLYYYSGSLWLSITAHFFNNAFAVTQMYILIQKGKSIKEAMSDSLPLWWGAIAVVVIYFLFIWYKKIAIEVKRKFTPPEEKALEEKWIA
ncbi:MAG: CPBP family intramembrane metalloprotease [Bacteroidetes bacterium]|nr:CPBP family intramembrane metalloprotease [Bacteroidota bacterium]